MYANDEILTGTYVAAACVVRRAFGYPLVLFYLLNACWFAVVWYDQIQQYVIAVKEPLLR